VARNNAIYLFVGGLCALLCSGCAQILGGNAELPQRRFYDFGAEVVRSGLADSERPYAVRVQIKTFDVQRAYNRTELVFRRDEYELHRDPLHSWVTRPGDLFTDAIQQYLRQADLFTYVGGDRDFYDYRPDYILTGSVKALERFDSGDVWAAHLAMSMELVRQEDALVIWQKDFDEERQVFFPEMKHTVAAFSQILSQQMEASMREIDFLFLNMERGNQAGSVRVDSLSLLEPDLSEQEADNRIDTDEQDYELLPGKIAQ
jgi:ABC-type uncharacterized transport system auxiliary subunit